MSVLDLEAARLAGAAASLAAYAGLCVSVLRDRRRRRAVPAPTPLLIAHASQTGAAEQLAWEAARALQGALPTLRVAPLGALSAHELAGAARLLIVASTCGAGDAPDAAMPFVRRLMQSPAAPSLAGLRYGLLALGDSDFADFCAFGRRLDDWLRACGARPLFERIDVDALHERDLARWRHELARLAGSGDAPTRPTPAHAPWRLARRTHLNPGSLGAPVFHLELEPPAGAPAWEPGDLLQVHVPQAHEPARPYSIASTPAEGRVHLLVRQQRRADGGLGLASGWLTQAAAVGDAIAAQVRPHRAFRLGDNAQRPLILIGNGTGIAGLRAHLSARAGRAGARHWLLFGERQAAHDFHFRADIEAWHAAGTLTRLDLAFSRDQPGRPYVQDRLRAQPAVLRQWLDDGAALYVCGSAHGMAQGVHDALLAIVGAARLERLAAEGRYRRDVY